MAWLLSTLVWRSRVGENKRSERELLLDGHRLSLSVAVTRKSPEKSLGWDFLEWAWLRSETAGDGPSLFLSLNTLYGTTDERK